jgi:hypothetical protein
MREKLTAPQRAELEVFVPKFADILIRLGRHYITAVKAAPGCGLGSEQQFALALRDAIVCVVESGVDEI